MSNITYRLHNRAFRANFSKMKGGPNITYIVENKCGQELAGNKLKLKWVQKDEIESKMGRE